MVKIFASDPIYPKLEYLNLVLSHAVNRWPFSPYEHMPDIELQIEIDELLHEIELEHINVGARSINFNN